MFHFCPMMYLAPLMTSPFFSEPSLPLQVLRLFPNQNDRRRWLDARHGIAKLWLLDAMFSISLLFLTTFLHTRIIDHRDQLPVTWWLASGWCTPFSRPWLQQFVLALVVSATETGWCCEHETLESRIRCECWRPITYGLSSCSSSYTWFPTVLEILDDISIYLILWRSNKSIWGFSLRF